MMCYIIKLMENKGKGYQVVFTKMPSDDDNARKSVDAALADNIGTHDMIVVYTDRRSIVALYDRTEEERDAFIEKIKSICPDTKIWPLYEPEEEE